MCAWLYQCRCSTNHIAHKVCWLNLSGGVCATKQISRAQTSSTSGCACAPWGRNPTILDGRVEYNGRDRNDREAWNDVPIGEWRQLLRNRVEQPFRELVRMSVRDRNRHDDFGTAPTCGVCRCAYLRRRDRLKDSQKIHDNPFECTATVRAEFRNISKHQNLD